MIIPADNEQAIAAAVRELTSGQLLGMPTETVYGLAADAESEAAVAKIFAAKGRPANHPLIVHVASVDAVPKFACQVQDFAYRLMDAFWPGPLTLILPRQTGVAAAAAGGQDSIGLRCPAHPVALALLRACAQAGVAGLAAPSANQFGRVSPTTAAHVQAEFGSDLLILDGGACPLGIESSIIDCTRGQPVLLRPGVLTQAQLEAAAGCAVLSHDALLAQNAPGPRASGTLESHYAPKAKVRLMDTSTLKTAIQTMTQAKQGTTGRAPSIALYARTVPESAASGMLLRRMPSDAASTARELFAVLRNLDEQGVALIWVEAPPTKPEWDGVRDRLQRASAH